MLACLPPRVGCASCGAALCNLDAALASVASGGGWAAARGWGTSWQLFPRSRPTTGRPVLLFLPLLACQLSFMLSLGAVSVTVPCQYSFQQCSTKPERRAPPCSLLGKSRSCLLSQGGTHFGFWGLERRQRAMGSGCRPVVGLLWVCCGPGCYVVCGMCSRLVCTASVCGCGCVTTHSRGVPAAPQGMFPLCAC